MSLKKTYILGGGESGVGAAILAKKIGREVFLSDGGPLKPKYAEELDKHGIEWEDRHHTIAKLAQADLIIKSPGIPEKADIMKKLRKYGMPIISEIEFAYRHCAGKVVAITGSNGKSTTTALTYHIFQKAGLDVGMAGNIGKSFARMVAEEPHKYYVLEVSSFQLDDIDRFKPHVAMLLNITPDHLDRYEYKFENYVASKFNIARNMEEEDFFIYNADDPVVAEAVKSNELRPKLIPISLERKPNAVGYTDNEELIINYKTELTMSINDLALGGKHNIYNSLAAGIAARIFDIRKDFVRESLSDFQNLDHRLEFVAKIGGVEYINDSKATNVNSTWYALESMNKPVVWVVGGVDKGNDYEILKPIVRSKVKAIVCLGLDNLRIHNAFSRIVDVIVNTESAPEAVKVASHLADSGDAVLLSPACASFDLFENYEDRGNQFKNAVRSL